MNLLKVLATLFIIALFCNSIQSAAPEVEEGVLVLTDENFEETVKAHQYILVEFYAPWCGHCKSLAPEYAKAAQKLQGQEPAIALAKVDATVHKKYSEKYGVQGFPTLKFFINEEAMEYGGGRTEPEIINWLKKKTQPSTSEVNSVEEVEKLMADNEVVVVYFGENNADFETFSKVTKTFDDATFAHTHSADLKSHYKAGSLVLFKNFDEKRNDFEGDFTSDNMKQFIEDNMFPTVMEFTQKAAERIFGNNLPALFVIVNESEASKSARAAYDSVTSQLKGKIVLSWSQIEQGLGKRLGDFVGVKDADLPVIMIVKPAEGDVKKYRLEGDITGDSIMKFYEDFNAGTLKSKLKSAEIPATNDEPVKVVVGKSFNDIVMDETKDVLVEFYAPWCGHCKSLAPKYDELAKKLLVNPNIVIAKMDSTENEAENVSISGFPTIKFFPANKKSEPMDYNGDREVAGFLKYLKEHTTFDWVDPDAAATEKAETKEDL